VLAQALDHPLYSVVESLHEVLSQSKILSGPVTLQCLGLCVMLNVGNESLWDLKLILAWILPESEVFHPGIVHIRKEPPRYPILPSHAEVLRKLP
jgi:hypothetical protein